MAVNLTINGVAYSFPNTSDEQWGDNVTNWATAVSTSLLQKSGGAFTLTAEVDFGATFGIKMLYIKSETANPAATGILRLAKTDIIAIRNNANSADITLFALNGSDQVLINGSVPLTNPMTTLGDVIYGAASGVVTRLAGDTSNTRKFLRELSVTSVATAPVWDTLLSTDIPSLDFAKITTGTVPLNQGGTGQTTKAPAFDALSPMTTANDIIYGGTAGTGTRLAGPTSEGQILRRVNSLPAWSNLDGASQIENLTLACSVAASALTIAVKTKAAADASATTPIYVGFRSSTAATGVYLQRSITAALSVVVPSATTLGLVSGQNEYIYVYLLDNAGTLELAVMGGANLVDEGSLATSTAIAGGNTRYTLYSTTARTSFSARLIGRLKSNQVTSGTYAAVPTEISLAPFKTNFAIRSSVIAYTGNGHGSTNTKIRRFTSNTAVGTAITYADSATLGGTFTINEEGLYSIVYQETHSVSFNSGVSVDSTQLTTSVTGINYYDSSGEGSISWISGAAGFRSPSVPPLIRLKPGQIVRAHTDGAITNAGPATNFTIIKVGE